MMRGFGRAPWWAVVVIVVGLVALIIGFPFALNRGSEPLSRAELDRIAAAESSAEASEAAVAPKLVAFMGDSYTAGVGASSQSDRFTTLVAAHEGWIEKNFGVGGTGYITAIDSATAQDACSLDRCPSYTEKIADAAAIQPDTVVVSGGRNESDKADDQGYAEGVADFYRQLRAALPDAQIIAASPIWSAGSPPAGLAKVGDAVRAGVTAVGGTYLDIGEPLRGHPEWLIADAKHPNSAGHAAIADAVDAALGALPALSTTAAAPTP